MSVTISQEQLEQERIALEGLGYKTYKYDFLTEPYYQVQTKDDIVSLRVHPDGTVEIDTCCYEAVPTDIAGLAELIAVIQGMIALRS